MNIFGPKQTISLLSVALWMVSSAFLAGNGTKRLKVFYGVTLSLLLFFKRDSVPGLPDEPVKGLMSVAGSILSVIISLTMGFTAAMTIGAAVYGFLYAVQPKLNM